MSEAVVVIGLQYGDEGKGTTIDYLAKRMGASLVVRFNGGAQAGHRVVLPDGREHVFSTWSSATLSDVVETYLAPDMMVNPIMAINEGWHLQEIGMDDPYDLLYVDDECPITTPMHMAINRLRELARPERHGSCGMGVGETMEDILFHPELVLRSRDLFGPIGVLEEKLEAIQQNKAQEALRICDKLGMDRTTLDSWRLLFDPYIIRNIGGAFIEFALHINRADRSLLQGALRRDNPVLFEGAQGILLDQDYGFQPHTSWSDCTPKGALKLLDECGFQGKVTKLGVLRAYATRHGAGPFVTEDRELTDLLPDAMNTDDPWQQSFRVGHLDLVSLKYAVEVCGGVDGLVLTHLDRLQESFSTYKAAYEYYVWPSNNVRGHGTITRIPVFNPTSYALQEWITGLLNRSDPRYVSFTTMDFMRGLLMETLQAPIEVYSYGPTAYNKFWKGHGC